MANQEHPIFDDIENDDLEAVKARVLADTGVLDVTTLRPPILRQTPLQYAIRQKKLQIAHWFIEQRGQQDLETPSRHGNTALHRACKRGQLSVVQALIVAGANTSSTGCESNDASHVR